MAELVDFATDPVEASIEQLLMLAKKRGFLTWEEMNEILPDEAISPDKLEVVMMRLEQNEIEMVDEAEADRQNQAVEPFHELVLSLE